MGDHGDVHRKTNLYIWGWPSYLGGADTKLAHLISLIHEDYYITVIPNDANQLRDKTWTDYLDSFGVKYCSINDVPMRLDGISLSMCNPRFFDGGLCQLAKSRGSKVVWSAEMMWHHNGELDAVRDGLVDKVLFVSEVQRSRIHYPGVPWSMVGNYIDPQYFPYEERSNDRFTIGRLSRQDPDKYPEDFPVFYESFDIPDIKFRVMAWSADLGDKYKWHYFDNRWDLLAPNQETQLEFLQSLDVFMYQLGHKFTESWGRSTVEAMLTGVIPFVQTGHNFENLIEHGVSGYILDDFCDINDHLKALYEDSSLRRKMSKRCAEYARERLCNREEHRRIWKEALDV